MDEGTLIMSGLHKVNVIDSIKIVTAQFNRGIIPRIISDYNVDNVSNKIIKIIQSYTGYVNRTVWKKS
jgi:UDP-N-acetylglucosamine 2-epimerase (non-hydrolysing)